jgi:hypothetical protein
MMKKRTLEKLRKQLDEDYPDWEDWRLSVVEAAVEVGLLDQSDLAALEVPELDFSQEKMYKTLGRGDWTEDEQ